MTEINEGASKIRSFSPFVVVCLSQVILNHYTCVEKSTHKFAGGTAAGWPSLAKGLL
jgi:hypothetical protein